MKAFKCDMCCRFFTIEPESVLEFPNSPFVTRDWTGNEGLAIGKTYHFCEKCTDSLMGFVRLGRSEAQNE